MSDIKRNAIVIGITGGIACGKSEVGRILREMEYTVCDADSLAHDLMRKGTSVFDQIVSHFGKDILSDEGEISRPILGKIIFYNPDQREILNKLVHPAVREALIEWIKEKRSLGQNAAVLIPLLYESGMQNLDWNSVICVSSSEGDVFQRLEKRGLSNEEAESRIYSQMEVTEKEKLADYVVPNSGTLGELELATRKIVQAIVG
ncbi:MAG: dephospho-CoA kinase [Pontiella sp.]